MIRHLHPTDSPGLLKFSKSAGQVEVRTLLGSLIDGRVEFPTLKYASIALSPRAWQSCWIETRRRRIDGVLKAGPRSGTPSWEVSELYLRKSKEELAVDLLEQISIHGGWAGAQRIFLRTTQDSRIYENARRVGFSRIYHETVYRSESAHITMEKLGVQNHSLDLRPRYESDKLGLVQMYNSITPIEARMKSGQMSPDWTAGFERLGRKSSDWVYEMDNGSIGALIQSKSTRSSQIFTINYAREAHVEFPGLLSAALAGSKDVPVSTTVPEFTPALSHFLVMLGFKKIERYEVMVKPLARTVGDTRRVFAAIV